MTLVYYVSGHGLGHAARACEVLKALPADLPLAIRSEAPECFFRAELGRAFEFAQAKVDVALVHRDSVTIDKLGSLRKYAEFWRDPAHLEREASFLREVRARLVVSDAPALAFPAAQAAGVESALVGNFTWADILAPFTEDYPEFEPLVSGLRDSYGLATRSFVTELALDMPYLRRVERVPMIVRHGTSRRAELARALGLDADQRWVLYYPGTFGLNVDLSAVLAIPKLRLLSFTALPSQPAGVVVVDREHFAHADVVASVDAVVSKPGYMLAGECMAAGVPLMLVERRDFAEDLVVMPALAAWGGLVLLSDREFASGSWRAALERALKLTPRPRTQPSGAPVVARRLAELYAGTPRAERGVREPDR